MARNAVNLDDPSTWPDDIDELDAMSDEGIPEDEDTEASTENDVGDTEEAESEESETDESKEDEAAEFEDEVTEDEKGEAETDEEELPIATKDGKRTIPYDVLKAERQKAAQAKAELAEMKAEIDNLRKSMNETAPKEETKSAKVETPEHIQAKAEKLREDWGDEIADQFLRTYELESMVSQQAEIIKQLNERADTRDAVEKRTEEQQIQDAIDNSPEMVEWQSDVDSPWYQRAVRMDAMLQETDPTYAAMNWHDRFQVLPSKVKAAFGVVEETRDEPKPKVEKTVLSEQEKKAKVDEALKKAGDKAPTSMSDLPSGDAFEADELNRLDGMSAAQVQAHIDKLAEDPERLDAYLRSIE